MSLIVNCRVFLLFHMFSLICPITLIFFLYPIKKSAILVLIELKDMDLIENPVFDFNINDIWLLFNILDFSIVKSFIKNVGNVFPVPKGSIFFKFS